MDNLEMLLSEELQQEFLEYLKEDPEVNYLESLNEEVLTEGKLLNKIRWKLALFSLKFLSKETLDDFFKAYYSKKPEKIEEILRLKRREKYKLLRKIANERMNEDQKTKIANSEAAKKCEKAAMVSGISTGISALSTGFAVARAANATAQYLASTKEAEANQAVSQKDPTKEHVTQEKIEQEEVKQEKVEQEKIEQEEVKQEKVEQEPTKEEYSYEKDASDGIVVDSKTGKVTLINNNDNIYNDGRIAYNRSDELDDSTRSTIRVAMDSDSPLGAGSYEYREIKSDQQLFDRIKDSYTRLINNTKNENIKTQYENKLSTLEKEFRESGKDFDKFLENSKALTDEQIKSYTKISQENNQEFIDEYNAKIANYIFSDKTNGKSNYSNISFDQMEKINDFKTVDSKGNVTIDVERTK